MQNIINSFKAHMYERSSSPLIGAFMFYWLICNYKLIMIILDGDSKIKDKFNLIKEIYPQGKITLWTGFDLYYQILWGTGLLIPLLITLTYVLILPFASNFIYKLWIKHQNKLKEISNGKVLTKKEYGELQRNFTKLELSFDENFSKKDQQINSLKTLIMDKDSSILKYQEKIKGYTEDEKALHKENNELHLKIEEYEEKEKERRIEHKKIIEKKEKEINDYFKEIQTLKNKIEALKPNTTELENKIMELYTKNYKNLYSLYEIKDKIEASELKTKYAIKKLTKDSLIIHKSEKISPNNIRNGYGLTDIGENFLVENKLID